MFFLPPSQTGTMMENSAKLSVIGTRSGNVIRFTCPNCFHEHLKRYSTPKDFYKDSRDVICTQCRTRFMVVTPGS
jgi:transcription elongation factor Elf1